jgi:hypothetical protein
MNWARIFGSVALAAFAVAATGNGLDRLSRQVPTIERAVPLPFRAQADRAAAVVALSRQQYVDAVDHARAAVLHDPVDPDSTALLGSALLANGKASEAETAFRIAARFGWRNVATQVYWYQAALQAGDFEVATDRVDAILRSHPAYPERNTLLAPLEADPRGRALLARHLRQSPKWLPYYLDVSSGVPADLLHGKLQVLALASAGNFRFDCAALSTPITRLIDVGRHDEARNLWNANCPQAPAGPGVVDPTFDLLARNVASPFGWQPQLAGDVSMSFEGEGAGRRLVLANSAPIGHVVLEQPVAFAPGSYRVSIEGNAPAVASAALSWGCEDGAAGSLSRVLAKDGDTVKVASCSRQLLGLWLPAHASGMIFRTVKLMPLAQ